MIERIISRPARVKGLELEAENARRGRMATDLIAYLLALQTALTTRGAASRPPHGPDATPNPSDDGDR